MTPTLMIDVAACSLEQEEVSLLTSLHIAGVILFGKNVQSPEQVRSLTDSLRAINPNFVIATDQEGGRVARLRQGFTPLPAMGRLGVLYQKNQEQATKLAHSAGHVMACEVLAVGIDASFAPVLDIDNGSLVIGDRAFGQDIATACALASAFIDGMNKAGMGATGKHFPGHGSVVPDSHTHDATDHRSFDEIWQQDAQVFVRTLDKLTALMPAHVVFPKIDNKPAGFSSIWLKDILRGQLGFGGALFSDDLSMKAAHIAGGVPQRVAAALGAGCDVALICNDRQGVLETLAVMDTLIHLLPSQNRIKHLKSQLPAWAGSLNATCQSFDGYQDSKADLEAWCA